MKQNPITNAITLHRGAHENVRIFCELAEGSRGMIVSATVFHGDEKVAVNQSYVTFEAMSNLDIVRDNTLLAALHFAGTSVEAPLSDEKHEPCCGEEPTRVPTTEVEHQMPESVADDVAAPAVASDEPVGTNETTDACIAPATDTPVEEKKSRKRNRKNASEDPATIEAPVAPADTEPSDIREDISDMPNEDISNETEAAAENEAAEGSESVRVEEVTNVSADIVEEAAPITSDETEVNLVSENPAEEVPEHTETTAEPEATEEDTSSDGEMSHEQAMAVILTAKPDEKSVRKISASALNEYVGKPIGELANNLPSMISILAARAGTAASVLSEESEKAIKIIAGI